MIKVSVTKTINVPANIAWATLADFGGVYKYNPQVKTSPLLSANNSGLGASRKCHFVDNTSVVEKIVGWEEGREIKIELSEFSLPLKALTAIVSVADAGNNQSTITYQALVHPKFGVIGSLMGTLMIKPMMSRVFSKVIDGLEKHILTGEIIGKDGKPMKQLSTAA